MSTLTVYDTTGNRYADGSATAETDESIKDLFYGGVRFAIETGRQLTITVFFRAKESENARSEQFYARFETRSDNQYLSELLSALEETIEGDWGYTIDNSSSEMNLYQVLRDGKYEVPGTEVDHDIVSDLLSQGRRPRLGVADEDNAVGLLNVFVSNYTTAAITDSIESSSISTYDLVVVPGKGRGVTPLGETAEQWSTAQESARESSVFEAVNTVRSAVNELSRTHGLDDDEIRSVVFGEVPALQTGRAQTDSASTVSMYPSGVQQAVTEIREAVERLSQGHGLSDGEIRQKITQQVPTLKTPGSTATAQSSTAGSTTSETSTSSSGSFGSPEDGSLGDSFNSSGSSSGIIPADQGTILAVVMVLAGLLLVGGSLAFIFFPDALPI